MKKLILLIVFIVLVQVFADSQSDYILTQLLNEEGWEKFKEKDGAVFRRKEISGFDLYALEITRKITVSPEAVFSVLLDVADYGRVLGENKYLEAAEIEKTSSEITGYQYAKIPVIPNRHYLFTFDLTSYNGSLDTPVHKLDWVLIESNGEYSDYIDKQNREKNNPVYIKNGAGSWSIKKLPSGEYENSYRLYLDPAGWMPGWLVNTFNVGNLQELFDKVIAAAEEG